jgi:hypothetical protein
MIEKALKQSIPKLNFETDNVVNMSAISRMFTGHRTYLKRDYKGKKYREVLKCVNDFETKLKKIKDEN